MWVSVTSVPFLGPATEQCKSQLRATRQVGPPGRSCTGALPLHRGARGPGRDGTEAPSLPTAFLKRTMRFAARVRLAYFRRNKDS